MPVLILQFGFGCGTARALETSFSLLYLCSPAHPGLPARQAQQLAQLRTIRSPTLLLHFHFPTGTFAIADTLSKKTDAITIIGGGACAGHAS